METEQMYWNEMDEAIYGLPEAEERRDDGWGPLDAAELARIKYLAEHPEYADCLLQGICEHPMSLKEEEAFKKAFIAELSRGRP